MHKNDLNFSLKEIPDVYGTEYSGNGVINPPNYALNKRKVLSRQDFESSYRPSEPNMRMMREYHSKLDIKRGSH